MDNARCYDPALGRFAQADTIVPGMHPMAFDRYSYVQNNPLGYTDPSGHRLECGEAGGGGCCSGGDSSIPPYEVTGPITSIIIELPGSAQDWNNIAFALDALAWLTDLYAVGAVTYGGIAGAALPSPLIAIGLPEIPLATGLAGIAIAELYVQPVLFTGNSIATLSLGATIVADTKAGNTIIEEGKFSSSVLNSIALTDIGWMSNEAYLSLILQSISVANDLQLTSLPFPIGIV